MKREIKFRAWDKESKRMLFRGVFDRNWYATEYNDKDGCHCVKGIHPNDRHSLELMESAGLKDKNRKEIYEGDILSPMSNDLNPKYNGNWVVDFRDGTFIAKCENGIDDQWIPYWSPDIEIEVIGNIHEDPELI